MSRLQRTKVKKLPGCPICGRPRDARYRPFCSARCRDLDLGRWFNQAYSIPAQEPDERPDEADDEIDEG